jgi:hypothetical protein
MGNGAMARGPKLPRPSSTLPKSDMASRSEAMELRLPPALSRLLLELQRLLNRGKRSRGLAYLSYRSGKLGEALGAQLCGRAQSPAALYGIGIRPSVAPVSVRTDTLMQLSRSSLSEIRLVQRGRAIHPGTFWTW